MGISSQCDLLCVQEIPGLPGSMRSLEHGRTRLSKFFQHDCMFMVGRGLP